MRRVPVLVVTACLCLPACGAADPSTGATAAAATAIPPAADYAEPANWLCWPGRTPNACAADLTTTVIEADGRARTETFATDPAAPVDCFYVYPTVSMDPGLNATLAAAPEEQRVVLHQLARFGARCRLFAPLYRQFTLAALRAALSGHPLPGADNPAVLELGLNDVKAAWAYYLAHENHGRGVVLIGHSQGSGVLTRLIRSEIDGKPTQALLVSAILMGTNLNVPEGADVGGDFMSVPLCRRAAQTGCAIAFASFRASAPPPPNSIFGRPRPPAAGMVAACVNPAALGGGPGELKAYFGSGTELLAGNSSEPVPWAQGLTVTTPFVSVPGLLSAQCVSADGFNYLAVTVHSAPSDLRTHDIPGDIVRNGTVRSEWGLHLVDANLTIGNLLDVVAAQAAAWGATHPAPPR